MLEKWNVKVNRPQGQGRAAHYVNIEVPAGTTRANLNLLLLEKLAGQGYYTDGMTFSNLRLLSHSCG